MHVFIGYGVNCMQYYKVILTGYRDIVSSEAFDKAMREAAWTLSHNRKPLGFGAYEYIYHTLGELSLKQCISGELIKLKDFYEVIGYEPKRKKLRGKTLKQWILGKGSLDERRISYYRTVIVSFTPQLITLNHGGYMTTSTKARMNKASKQFGLDFQVFQKDFEWFVRYNGEVIAFEGVELKLNRVSH